MFAGRRVSSGLLLIVLLAVASAAYAGERACDWVADRPIADTTPALTELNNSPTRHRQLPLFRELMQRPLTAPCRASGMLQQTRQAIESPQELFRWAAGLGGLDISPGPEVWADKRSAPGDVDPLLAGLAWMKPAATAMGTTWPPPVPDRWALPEPLRDAIGHTLEAIGQAHRLLERALAQLPTELTPQSLRDQLALPGHIPDDATDLRRLLPLLDREALATGMVELIAAAEGLHRVVAAATALPRVAWRAETPFGTIVVDTTGADTVHRLAAPLLVLDVGGNDRYEFDSAPAARHIAVVLDHGGDDRYVARAAGADPSAATLGYGILWDSAGDDLYEGSDFAQAAALFGAALLVDGGGANRFVAAGHAQGYALGGTALLVSGAGNDEFVAQTHAQGSAGPEAVAMLIDRAGSDRYTLDNVPLSRPSPQLPTHNTSMGQGAGRGLRPAAEDGLSTTGGIGALIDLDGDDRYSAQVFAQGAGYYEGLGLLIDGGGDDRFDAAWYAMGAAAHQAAGVLLKLGGGNDRYRATHSTSLGAAHDLSIAVFLDEGGDDDYRLGDLGFGASHDGGVAVFVDLAGHDRYQVDAAGCRAFGFAQTAEPNAPLVHPLGRGLFIDSSSAADPISTPCRLARGAIAPAGKAKAAR